MIEHDPHSSKALFRRGCAHLARGRDVELAIADLQQAQLIMPHNAEVTEQLRLALDMKMRNDQEDKARYARMLNK